MYQPCSMLIVVGIIFLLRCCCAAFYSLALFCSFAVAVDVFFFSSFLVNLFFMMLCYMFLFISLLMMMYFRFIHYADNTFQVCLLHLFCVCVPRHIASSFFIIIIIAIIYTLKLSVFSGLRFDNVTTLQTIAIQ